MSKPRPTIPAIGITLGGIALLAALVFSIPALHEAASDAIHGDDAGVRDDVHGLGVAGPLLIIALALIHSIVFYPAEIVDAAAGFAYGFLPAVALMMFAWLLSSLLCFAIGRSVARPMLDRWFGTERFTRTEMRIERGGSALLISLRLLPIVPFSLVSYAAGAARVPVWRFLWTTAIGYLPITVIAVYLGTRLKELNATDPLVLGCAGALLVLLIAGYLAARRGNTKAI